LDWFEAYENLRVAKSSYRENLKLLENINARRQSRIAKRIDVNKINIQVLGKKEALVDFEEKYASALNLIKRAIRYEDSTELVPARPPEAAFAHESFDAVKDEFKENSRTYKILRKLEKQASLEAEREADNLFPSLDLLVSFKRSGERGDLRDREDFVGAGLSLEWPIEFRRPEHEAAKIEEKRARLKTTSTHYRLSADVKNLELAIMREKALGEIAAEKITLAETILKDESEDYTYARSSLNDYIDAVNRLDNNRFNQIRREALYRRLNIEWLRITDRLVGEKLVSDHQKDGLGWPRDSAH
jgi:outer membrane protein TolC